MPKRVERFDGQGSFQDAQRLARFGHSDWIVWSDAAGSHAARKSPEVLRDIIASPPTSWALISANDGIAMKGYPWLAANLLAWLT